MAPELQAARTEMFGSLERFIEAETAARWQQPDAVKKLDKARSAFGRSET